MISVDQNRIEQCVKPFIAQPDTESGAGRAAFSILSRRFGINHQIDRTAVPRRPVPDGQAELYAFFGIASDVTRQPGSPQGSAGMNVL